MKSIGDKIKELPPELQQEVEDFVEFLLEKRRRKPAKKLRQDLGRRSEGLPRPVHIAGTPEKGAGMARGLIVHVERKVGFTGSERFGST